MKLGDCTACKAQTTLNTKREAQNVKKYPSNHRETYNIKFMRATERAKGLFMTSNCVVWHHIFRSKIKSALHNTFQAARSRENNATTQTTLTDQQHQNNQHTRAVAFERSTTNSSCQNKFYAQIDLEQVTNSASYLLKSTSNKQLSQAKN